ncbi:MAG: prolyl aminopeptidase [Phycisphaerales bacterium]|nr:MAG: prolyl aminopeptidase [Phycisphaerales bacterium]
MHLFDRMMKLHEMTLARRRAGGARRAAWGVCLSILTAASFARAQETRPADAALFPAIEPFESGYLQVSDIHQLYFETCGNPKGKPVFVLHGGPGGGCSARMRRFFNPDKYLIVLHDQRGAGKSKPYAELRENTTQNLVEDIEHLRKKLNLGRIIIFGGSWGSTLGLAYAETYPGNVSAMVLRGLWTCTKEELEYWYGGGVADYFPEEYEKLLSVLPPDEKGTVPQRLLRMLQSDDPQTRRKASLAWAGYEIKLAHLDYSDEQVAAIFKRWDPYDFALLENYYMVNDCFLEPDQLFAHAHKLKDIPITVVNGRYDVICPPITAWRFCRMLPKANLVIAERAGHSASEPPVTAALVAAMKELE